MIRRLVLGMVAAAALGGAAEAAPLKVVELFTSQGCSSCPPANANIARLADRPDVLALSFGVTYWDDLGWKDTFASRANTQRQWDYAHGLGHPNVFTPQVVVNGRADVVGTTMAEIDRARSRAAPLGGPSIALEADRVALGASPAPSRQAVVWLVRYDPRVVQVPVRRGENAGKTLPHRNVVRQLVRLGAYDGRAATYRLPPPADAAWRTAVLVQSGAGGPILAAARG